MHMCAKENDISMMKIKQHFRFLCFLIVTCDRKPVLGIFYLNYPSNKIIKIRKKLDKNITNIFFAEEPGYSISTTQLRFLALPQIFFVSLDYDLLYL